MTSAFVYLFIYLFIHSIYLFIYLFFILFIYFYLQDLGSSDLNKDLFIVAHVMRIGKMLHSESGKKLTATLSNSSQNSNCSFKRPFGVGVLNIGAELTTSNGYRLNDTDLAYIRNVVDMFQVLYKPT